MQSVLVSLLLQLYHLVFHTFESRYKLLILIIISRFPKETKKAWITALKLENVFVGDRSVVCSGHFHVDAFHKHTGGEKGKKMLLKGAIPASVYTVCTKQLDDSCDLELISEKSEQRTQKYSPPSSPTLIVPTSPKSRSSNNHLTEHNSILNIIPTAEKENITFCVTHILEISKLREEIRKLTEKNMGLKKEVQRLTKSDKKHVEKEASETFIIDKEEFKNLPKVVQAILRRINTKSRQFEDDLRKFAMQLEFVSPAAYRYVYYYFSCVTFEN